MADNDLDLENGLDMKDLTPEELEAIKKVQWVNENPDKVEWVKCNELLEDYAL